MCIRYRDVMHATFRSLRHQSKASKKDHNTVQQISRISLAMGSANSGVHFAKRKHSYSVKVLA
ncbi:hypothetical protein KP509_23G066800 [Ceratopteris richardii]|uniref:Uncharacterized protein n=1 Tax=Ceratopteris richardii TaxID=49495 RepID=A0A8T2S3V1_CERRI|nr:hypothetical protein KP509_23G066800 [Ceratopteris richardii]